jgi:hypothetical protein
MAPEGLILGRSKAAQATRRPKLTAEIAFPGSTARDIVKPKSLFNLEFRLSRATKIWQLRDTTCKN